MQGNWKSWRNSFLLYAKREKNLEKMTRKEFFPENVDIFGGPRTETKFVKWSASRKRLRTAAQGERANNYEADMDRQFHVWATLAGFRRNVILISLIIVWVKV